MEEILEHVQKEKQKGKVIYHYISSDDYVTGMLGLPIKEKKGKIPECCKERLRELSLKDAVDVLCNDGCHLITQWVWGPSCIDGAYNREIIIRERK